MAKSKRRSSPSPKAPKTVHVSYIGALSYCGRPGPVRISLSAAALKYVPPHLRSQIGLRSGEQWCLTCQAAHEGAVVAFQRQIEERLAAILGVDDLDAALDSECLCGECPPRDPNEVPNTLPDDVQ